ncbi:hypothetical protein INT45_006265 [Circinella minor]|uniref:MOSC domain-containing protein n=1 Tax=Circinella minor TaxID=1195481 RepID=A0A8H7S133_9FUNG|nr:hypothetical protein INT45_006265 [Circinella minor]
MPSVNQIKLSAIRAYPIKSCHGIELTEAHVTNMGLSVDRRFMFIEAESGRFITQRKYSSMALIRPLVDTAADTLTLTAEGQPDLVLPLHPKALGRKYNATLWADKLNVFDMGDEASKWIGNFMESHREHNKKNPTGDIDFDESFPELRLVTLDDPKNGLYSRPALESLPGVHSPFSDWAPLSIGCESSLEEVNNGLKETGVTNDSIPIDRFRNNLTFSGTIPWEEDEWLVVKIGEVTCYIIGPTARCPVPGIDQDTAVKDIWGGVTKYLSKVRNIPISPGKNNGCFCVDTAPLTSGTIHVGDTVEILERVPAKHVYHPVPPTTSSS